MNKYLTNYVFVEDFPGGSVVKNPLAKAGNTSLISATHSSILAWKIPWDTCTCMAEFLCYSPETITTL